ncbi:MAG TPA: Mut7-C RNAse domain-containing protein [Candidatus Polarisedimenticolia bacterium]|nr:Mut7-C RNAse domain-containing protein [Candidatus Polarisedimenticolia bacterium]
MDGTPPRFLADAMLGRLATWLRLLGLDAAYAPRLEDLELIRRARAEGRILLTRDRALAGRRAARGGRLRLLLVSADRVEEQIREVAAAAGIRAEGLTPLSRCSVCNEPTRPAGPEEVAGLVPPYVLATQARFSRCPACNRVFWRATHVAGILRRLREALAPGAFR